LTALETNHPSSLCQKRSLQSPFKINRIYVPRNTWPFLEAIEKNTKVFAQIPSLKWLARSHHRSKAWVNDFTNVPCQQTS